jgi:acetyl esterase/lipase
MMKYFCTLALGILLASSVLYSQSRDTIVYKQIDSTILTLVIDYPPGYNPEESYPALVFFFGGGWNGGSTDQFEPHASYFAQRGMICFRADYRVKSRHNTSPFESLKDAKSAIRFVREHAKELGVDPHRVVASGGSAGGHLAAATALSSAYNEGSDQLSYSCVPDALVLFNPVMDNGPGGYGYERIGEAYKEFSPLHNIREGAPPTIMFLGTKDILIPVETAEYYKVVMEKVGSRCDLQLYEGQGHGFFNYRQFEIYKNTISKTNEFLISLEILPAKPEIVIE